MAGRIRKKDEAVIPSNSLIASATRYSGKAARIYQNNQNWQKEAYRHFAICGEARFAAKFFGHALSRATLSLAVRKEGEVENVTSGPGFDALEAMFAGSQGQPQMLEALGTHLTIAGECYIVGREYQADEDFEGDPPIDDTIWEVVSIMEMHVLGDKWTIKYGSTRHKDVELTDDDIVIRVWIPNPEKRMEAESPFKSLLPILSEIEWLTRHVFAQVQSRLAGAGILFVDQNMTFPDPPAVEGQQLPANMAERLMLALADAMMKPIQDPSSPAAVIPIVIAAEGENIDKNKLMHFWSDLDENSMALRNEAIQRFARGMDLPIEQVMGMSSNSGTGGGTSNGISHWGAWQVEEATIKMHIEPMLELVCNAITMGYIRPANETGNEFVVYNTEALRLRPDRSQESIVLYNMGLIKGEVVIEENGFEKKDMMDDEERKVWLLVKIATGSATPEQVQAALGILGVELPVAAVPASPPAAELPSPPSMEELPPPRQEPERQALLAASEALVFRALERAGNRLRQAGSKPPNCPSYETHTLVPANGSAKGLLEDAWSCAPQVLDGIAKADEVVPVLDAYCQTLLAEQTPHSRSLLTAWLDRGVPA